MKSRDFIIIFLSLIFTSCSWPNWGKNDQPKIRIVDLQGKSHDVVTKVPELNSQALAAQGKINVNTPKFVETKSLQTGEIKYQNYQDQNIANAKATSNFPQVNPTNSETTSENLGTVTKDNNQTIEYNLADTKTSIDDVKNNVQAGTKYVYKKNNESELKNLKSENSQSVSAKTGKKFFVQVGSFSSFANAESILKKMKKFHDGKVETLEGEKTIYRVLLGPLENRTKAKQLANKITSSGHDAIITKSE